MNLKTINAGDKFGELTIIKEITRGKRNGRRFVCKCSCGNKKIIYIQSLTSGHTKSCGCLVIKKQTKHGMFGTKTYVSYYAMRQRCENKNHERYSNYGGRGISVCKRWSIFKNFYNDMGERPEGLELERINTNKGYNPRNCKWASKKKNMQNRIDAKIWVINKKEFGSSYDAARALNVSQSKIVTMCKAGKRNGKIILPLKNCFVRSKYK